MSEKLWNGRFTESTDRLVEVFTASHEVDRRLYAHDIQGSSAHVETLEKAGVLNREEADVLLEGLLKVRIEIESGEFVFSDSLEDIHMHVEKRLAELVGETAHKLHTGRSRNDQVATDVRLYLRDEVDRIIDLVRKLRQVMVDLAQKHPDWIMPGYTHLQRAQPVLLSHHFMAYYEMFSRDQERLQEALVRINVMPLGSAALAGTPFPLDREYTAGLLGFSGICQNSIDAVSDRDFMLEFSSLASIIMVHLSRLSEELVIWNSTEFGFVTLPDAFATGSSIMPQKKNPDVPELVRGKTGRVYGNLMALLNMMKSLPLAYNRDMQEDKPPLFDTIDTIKGCLAVMGAMLPRCVFNKARLESACLRGFLNATDLADFLVEKGMPFRKAHHIVGKSVAHAAGQDKELTDLTTGEFQDLCGMDLPGIIDRLSIRNSIDSRKSLGGTAQELVEQAVLRARAALDKEGLDKT